MNEKIEVLAILQARMSSTRMPGKVLCDLLGEPMILRQIERLRKSNLIDHLVVATSNDPSDDQLVLALVNRGIDVYRGSLTNVFSRYIECARNYQPKRIVRVTGDCPVIDWRVVDQVIELNISSNGDYASNTINRSFPRGLDVECFTYQALIDLANMELSDEEKEHVTMGFYHRPNVFTLSGLHNSEDLSSLRWTVDYPADFRFIEEIYSALFPSNSDFSAADVKSWLSENPEYSRYETDVGAGH